MDLDALLFDKDGTLFDFEATWGHWAAGVLTEIATAQGLDPAKLGHQIGFDLATQTFSPGSTVIAGTPYEIATEILPHLPNPPDLDMFVADLNAKAALAPQVEVTPLVALCDTLGPRFRLGVVTNDSEAPARAHLKAANVLDRFSVVIGSDSGVGFKPAPDPILAACARLDVDPARTAMIGDSTHDLHAGRAAGCITIGVLTGPATQAYLAPYADHVLPSVADLPDLLARR